MAVWSLFTAKLRPFWGRHLSSSRMVSSTSANFDLTSLVRPITVRTCVGLYPALHQLNPRLYPSSAPPEGLDITVDYLDTASTKSTTTKTILALPGSGGNYTHFQQLAAHFRNTNIRFIAPNFPDFSHTRSTKYYWHSNVEIVAFLKDFLTQISVQQIDCAISHSMGIHRILGLLDDPGPLQIRSIAFLAPQPLYDLKQKHVDFVRRYFFTFRNEPFYRFLNLTRIHKLPQIPVKFPHINDFLLFLVPALDSSFQNIDSQLARLAASSIPVTVFYGTNEKFISQKAREKLFSGLGIKKIVTIDPKTDPVSSVSGPERVKAVYLKGGGHFAYANYGHYTNQIIADLLSYSR